MFGDEAALSAMLDPGQNNENIFACELCMVASACQSTAQGDAVERFDEGHSHRGRPPCFHEDVCDKDLAKLATDAASCRGAGKDCQWDEDEEECSRSHPCLDETLAFVTAMMSNPQGSGQCSAEILAMEDDPDTIVDERNLAMYDACGDFPEFVAYGTCYGSCMATEDGMDCAEEGVAALLSWDIMRSANEAHERYGDSIFSSNPGAIALERCATFSLDSPCAEYGGTGASSAAAVWNCLDDPTCLEIVRGISMQTHGNNGDYDDVAAGCPTEFQACQSNRKCFAEFEAAMEISDGSIADAELSQAQEINELAACMNGLDNELEEEEDEEDDQLDLSDSVSTQSRPQPSRRQSDAMPRHHAATVHYRTVPYRIFLLSSSPILLSYSRSWLLPLPVLCLRPRSDITTGVALQFWAKLGNPDQGLLESSGCMRNPLCASLVACLGQTEHACYDCSTADDFQSCSAQVNAACCDEPSEDCSSGQPASCNEACARVLVPMRDNCQHIVQATTDLWSAIDRAASTCSTLEHGGH